MSRPGGHARCCVPAGWPDAALSIVPPPETRVDSLEVTGAAGGAALLATGPPGASGPPELAEEPTCRHRATVRRHCRHGTTSPHTASLQTQKSHQVITTDTGWYQTYSTSDYRHRAAVRRYMI